MSKTTPENIQVQCENVSKTTLCLNMIVKNESKIITRLLDSVAYLLDSYCICDTGSTDNTVDLIETYFRQKNIPGKIVHEPFRDFGYNRTYALKSCETQDVDYLLLLDADMMFWVDPKITAQEFKQGLVADAYHVFQGTEHFFYKNVRMVKNRRGFSYWGVTHEYVQSPPDANYKQFERDYCFINDIGDGGCKTDKFLRDVKLLTKGLEDNPDNDRYTFYLANSYRDAGQPEKAIEYFKKRIKLGGWVEEVWHSYYSIGRCYKLLDDNANAIYYWMEAYNHFPNRIENLYEIIKHYRVQGNHHMAYMFYSLADYERKRNNTWDYLFLQKDVYDYKIDYELSIFGFYSNRDKHDLIKTCMKVLTHSGADDGICKNVLSNYKFYTNRLDKWAIPMPKQNQEVLQSIGKELLAPYIGEFASSTPTMCWNSDGELTVGVRYVNYSIDENGGYVNKAHIETKNVFASINIFTSEWRKTSEWVMPYDTSHDGLYVGLEDVRIMSFDTPDDIYYQANRGIGHHHIMVEHGILESAAETSRLLKYEKAGKIEKNWVIMEGETIKCIYQWHPLTVGDIVGSEFKLTHEIPTPNIFKYVRGSTNGVVVGDEMWFIGHVVSYEDRRFYYHIMIILDRKTYQLKKYTPLWTFEKAKVEYTLGFVYMKPSNRFLIGYSVMDKETKYIMVSKHVFDEM